jgi:hypothetical protein
MLDRVSKDERLKFCSDRFLIKTNIWDTMIHNWTCIKTQGDTDSSERSRE